MFHVNTINSDFLNLFMSARNTWIEAARSELKHENPLQQLQKQWREWSIKPYYDIDDRPSFNLIQKLEIPHKSSNGWLNIPIVSTKADDFNALAVSHLNSGSDGVLFQLSGSAPLKEVLGTIKPEFCFLGFEADAKQLNFFLDSDSLLRPEEKVYGAIFWNDTPEWLKIARLFKSYSHFRCFGIRVGTLDAENIERSFRDSIAALDELTDNTFPALHVLPKFAFRVTGTGNFFLDVAMIRSIKILFQRLVSAYGVSEIPAFVQYEAQSSIPSSYDQYGIMISNALSALCAVSASADAISIQVENQNSKLHQHTARSISVLLKEESKLDKVNDPLAGSYFIESLTQSIVEKIWANLRNS